MVTSRPGPLDVRHAQGNQVLTLGNFAARAIKHFRLDENNRIVVADGSLEQTLGVCRRGGSHNFQPRHMAEPRFQRLRVLRGELVAGAARVREQPGEW